MKISTTKNPARLSRLRGHVLIVGCLLAIGACNRGGDATQGPSAWIEDGTPAVEKSPDKVTKQAREFFAQWLRDHGESEIVNDDAGVGIKSSPTRLWAFLYGTDASDGRFSVETEFRIVLPGGREIVEFVAGHGDTEEAAIGMTFANFTLSTFHVVYCCFMNPDDPHMTHGQVQIGGTPRILTTGGMVAMGGEGLPDFAEVSQQVRDEICKLDLTDEVHWLKIVYGRHQNEVLAAAVTLDNEDLDSISSRLSLLDWPSTENFYMAKQFVVIRPAPEAASEAMPEETSRSPAQADELDKLLANVEVPPSWLDSVETSYDTSLPWKDARLEIRRLLSLGKPETNREAIKLTWSYLQKGDIGDGHEYPMYTFLGGEPVWSIRAHEEFVEKPHESTPIHSYVTLASLYARYGAFEKAKASLDEAMSGLPEPPWRIMRQADLMSAYGDLYVAWGKIDEAKQSYTKAADLYPKAKPPYGGHLLPRRAAAVRSKFDLLAFQSLASAALADGQYEAKALGYAGDIDVTVSIRGGRIADIQLKHEEKIDQNACVIIPRRIIDEQSLQVDAITGATVTRDAIIDGVYRALRKAGLK